MIDLNNLYGYRLINQKYIEEIDCTLYQLSHDKSGATIVYLDSTDNNKTFTIAFKTLPHDSTGVCHIIEHSTLCGSKKYPLKEPFVNLLKGSMATFLNAMTSTDKTLYPIASLNDKDFDNLMSVYLDAVFSPLSISDPKPFLQEGWHLGLNNKDDSREGIEKYLRRNPATSFVAVLDGKIVGVILCGHDGRRGIIQHACVSSDCRRMGIGKKLVDLALEALKKEGINKVLLVAFKKNEVGNAFWESQGFTLREDLNYRNKALAEMIRIDPDYLKEE